MYDRQTDSYWGQLLGEAIEGPLKGTKLTPVPATQTTWEEWRNQYPDTQALFTNGAGRYDSYASYYKNGSAGVLGETLTDNRLPTKELVTGAVIDGKPAAYPHSVLAQNLAVNDTVGQTDLTAWFDPRTGTARLFERTVSTESMGEQTLTFLPTDNELEFKDEETGSTWLLLNGLAVDGPLKGTALTAIPSTNSFWFGWKDWYPETYLFGVADSG